MLHTITKSPVQIVVSTHMLHTIATSPVYIVVGSSVMYTSMCVAADRPFQCWACLTCILAEVSGRDETPSRVRWPITRWLHTQYPYWLQLTYPNLSSVHQYFTVKGSIISYHGGDEFVFVAGYFRGCPDTKYNFPCACKQGYYFSISHYSGIGNMHVLGYCFGLCNE